MVVRAVVSRAPLLARVDADGRGVWVAKASKSDAILHPYSAALPVLNELEDLDNMLQHVKADALIGHTETSLETGDLGVRIQRCLQDEGHQDSDVQTILQEMSRVALDPVSARDMAEGDIEGMSGVLASCARAMKGNCEASAMIAAQVVAHMLQHRDQVVLCAVHRTPDLVTGLRALVDTCLLYTSPSPRDS
eukprot:TRINITY_DN8781_c0_g1_i3.p1 TRINITY_DN8781_c0_g1~~TRINITY_DN8781_c0_g1_i3.p1  ORF type:complete len:192 (-),score=38.67 TRINITY_DN8781_c0_g1_i3:137-712(-)